MLAIAIRAGVNIRNICGGKGNCGKCKAIVRKGKTDFKYDPQEKLLTTEEIGQGYVLACQTICKTDCEVLIPPESRIEGQKILSEAVIPEIKVNPIVRKLFVPPQKLSGLNHEQLIIKLQSLVKVQEVHASLDLKLKSIKNRCGVEGLTLIIATVEPRGILDIEVGDTTKINFGLAIDIGTTKVTLYLVDLVTGKIIGSESDYNRQLAYGEDLVSRVGYTVDRPEGAKNMQEAAIKTINYLVDRVAALHKVQKGWITEVCIAGNTVMTYLFVGEDASLLLTPEVEIPRAQLTRAAQSIGLDINPEAKVYCLPCVSRFLGGDAVCGVLLSQMYESEEISLLIDIGTNVEAIIGSSGWSLSSSAPAGPALEGWGIRFGIRSVEGAIDHLNVDPSTLKASYTVLGENGPKGICGSGLIDLMAEMFRNGILDSLGKINKKLDSPYLRHGEDGYEYVVVQAPETSISRDIVITEKDIMNLIDSKAAACSTMAVMLKKMSLSVDDIVKVYVCGAFANYMDLNSAMAIGLLPEFPKAQVTYLGNGSVSGAYLALVSQEQMEKAKEIAHLTTYFDLLKDADFMDEYTAAYSIPGKRELFPTWWETSRKR